MRQTLRSSQRDPVVPTRITRQTLPYPQGSALGWFWRPLRARSSEVSRPKFNKFPYFYRLLRGRGATLSGNLLFVTQEDLAAA